MSESSTQVDTESDDATVEYVKREAGAFAAYAVKSRLDAKSSALEVERARVTALTAAINDLRRFAPVSKLSEAQLEGYDQATKDLVLLHAGPVLGSPRESDLPPLGWGRRREEAPRAKHLGEQTNQIRNSPEVERME
ncbi:Uncharacterised protein (plasmid) [Tsukamurella tyrosinosolvens]|uniref:hypothetical protein n=1 Tax=Tsukamurella tyrosinosolvens TaxID=57704 RepID=UPI00079733BA|nr:hypothetical protein [Tsukamurella tyrosinosolvens]KXO90954.1 hypothetical protein AXK58_21205 [Tsukamurella tyrosinosolvens]VEH90463.1 Uncharacterised protein [Tsukamurella tyrosinosolvens]